MFKNSIYKNKKQNLAEAARYYFGKTRDESRKAKYTMETMVFTAMDVNEKMRAGNERAFGKYRR